MKVMAVTTAPSELSALTEAERRLSSVVSRQPPRAGWEGLYRGFSLCIS